MCRVSIRIISFYISNVWPKEPKENSTVNFDTKTNTFFRLILYISYLLIVWYPTVPHLLIIPISLAMLDNDNKNRRIKVFFLLLSISSIFYFFLNELDYEQKIGLSLVIFITGFSAILKKALKQITKTSQ